MTSPAETLKALEGEQSELLKQKYALDTNIAKMKEQRQAVATRLHDIAALLEGALLGMRHQTDLAREAVIADEINQSVETD